MTENQKHTVDATHADVAEAVAAHPGEAGTRGATPRPSVDRSAPKVSHPAYVAQPTRLVPVTCQVASPFSTASCRKWRLTSLRPPCTAGRVTSASTPSLRPTVS